VIEQQEKEIGKTRYRVRQLGASKGMRLLTRLYKLLGPSLADLLRGAGSGLADMPTTILADALRSLSDRLPDGELDALVDELSATTEITHDNGAHWLQLRTEKEHHFAGNYRELFAWLGFALEVNFSTFLVGSADLRSALVGLLKPVSSPSQSPKGSTGASTESQVVNDTRAGS